MFDQFEEIFTLNLAGDDRRATSQDFLGELAELVENRPPEALERAIESDPDLVENFLFGRQDYRIVLALREDFLASLDSLLSRAPSLGCNRYRLRPMSGRQGLDAILNPAPGLVAPDVAQEIIRFIGRPSAEDAFGIAGDAAEGFEVEPSLLSLVCRELNERRIARGLDQIGAELVAGSRDEIIEGFYERCLADQPEALRAFVEDRLLSDSGYRESITLDCARRALSVAGVPAEALDERCAAGCCASRSGSISLGLRSFMTSSPRSSARAATPAVYVKPKLRRLSARRRCAASSSGCGGPIGWLPRWRCCWWLRWRWPGGGGAASGSATWRKSSASALMSCAPPPLPKSKPAQ
jgi:hypothetical protein